MRDVIACSDKGMKIRVCRHGIFCYFAHDRYVGRDLDLYGEYSENEFWLFEKLLKPGMVVIEVGSNIGALTVPIARLVGDTGRVLAFEPQQVIFQQLCANLALNGLMNVWAERRALGNPHEAKLMGVPTVDYTQTNNFGGLALVDDWRPEMVSVVKLDDFLVEPHFLKIDCEGMELDVINGAQSIIAQSRPVIYTENPIEAGNSAALIQALFEHDYDCYFHNPLLWNPNNWRGSKENKYIDNDVPVVSANMLCIPAEIKSKIEGLKKIKDPSDKAFM